jgi:hypothetical protein
MRPGQEVLLNDRFEGVALLKKGQKVVTVLTSSPATADWRREDPNRPGWRL